MANKTGMAQIDKLERNTDKSNACTRYLN